MNNTQTTEAELLEIIGTHPAYQDAKKIARVLALGDSGTIDRVLALGDSGTIARVLARCDSGTIARVLALGDSGTIDRVLALGDSGTIARVLARCDSGTIARVLALGDSGTIDRVLALGDSGTIARVLARCDSGTIDRVLALGDSGTIARVLARCDSGTIDRVLARCDSGTIDRVKKVKTIQPNPKIYTQILEKINQTQKAFENSGLKKKALDMSNWHGAKTECGTPHCAGGWIVEVTPNGYDIEKLFGMPTAAMIILKQSRPEAPMPNFNSNVPNDAALAFIKSRAAEEI